MSILEMEQTILDVEKEELEQQILRRNEFYESNSLMTKEQAKEFKVTAVERNGMRCESTSRSRLQKANLHQHRFLPP